MGDDSDEDDIQYNGNIIEPRMKHGSIQCQSFHKTFRKI